MPNLRNIEIFLAQCVIYLLIWLIDDYTGTLITFIMVPVLSGILIIALLAELVDRSKVPRRYFYVMLLSILAPALVAIVFGMLMGFNYDWVDVF